MVKQLSEKQQIIETGRKLWQRGMVAANDGNLSCRTEEGIYITATGVSKGFLKEDEILLLDQNGKAEGKESVETGLHLAVYEVRPDVNAIIHSHAPWATAFAMTEANLNSYALEDIRLQLGEIARIPYAEAGSTDLAELTAKHLDNAVAALLTSHGVLTVGENMQKALFRMEALEQAAKIVLLSEILRARANHNQE